MSTAHKLLVCNKYGACSKCSLVPRPFPDPTASICNTVGILQVIKYWWWEWPGNEAIVSVVCVLQNCSTCYTHSVLRKAKRDKSLPCPLAGHQHMVQRPKLRDTTLHDIQYTVNYTIMSEGINNL